MIEAAPTPPSPPLQSRIGGLLRAVAEVFEFVIIFCFGGLLVAGVAANPKWHGWTVYGSFRWVQMIVIAVYFGLALYYVGGKIRRRIFGIR
jgi:hypothetical protein